MSQPVRVRISDFLSPLRDASTRPAPHEDACHVSCLCLSLGCLEFGVAEREPCVPFVLSGGFLSRVSNFQWTASPIFRISPCAQNAHHDADSISEHFFPGASAHPPLTSQRGLQKVCFGLHGLNTSHELGLPQPQPSPRAESVGADLGSPNTGFPR